MPIGLYIHVPFCKNKCPYCDFYSIKADYNLMDGYTKAVCREIKFFGSLYNTMADTLYFGGGTPTLLGSHRLIKIINKAKQFFSLKSAEITVEANPESLNEQELYALRQAGINRLSIGLQSAVDSELKALGRTHSHSDAQKTIAAAKRAGFDNISLDIMLGIGGQTETSLCRTIDFCISQDIQHISAYMLKIEKGTPFFNNLKNLSLPDAEATSRLYENTCKLLNGAGFLQYEISNFAKKGYESRHNLKYWNCEQYLGIGPSAHSFIVNRRFSYTSSIKELIKSPKYIEQGEGGDPEEYIMLRLRLTEGIIYDEYYKRYNKPLDNYIKRAKQLPLWVACDSKGIRLKREGFLLSNSIIGKILYG